MKLKTKLLPLVGAAAVCATVAPITLTSCGTNTTLGTNINLMEKFNPKGVQHEYGLYEYETLMEDYFNDVMDNKELFAQDYTWSKAKYISLMEFLVTEYVFGGSDYAGQTKKNLKFSLDSASSEISNLSVQERQFLYIPREEEPEFENELTLKVPTASFDFKYSIGVHLVLPGQQASSVSEINMTVEANVSYKNIPYIIVPLELYIKTIAGGYFLDAEVNQLLNMVGTRWATIPFTGWMNQYSTNYKNVTEEILGTGSVGAPLGWSINADIKSTMAAETTESGITRDITEEELMHYDMYAEEMDKWYGVKTEGTTPREETIYRLLTMPDFLGYMLLQNMPINASTAISEYLLCLSMGACTYSWYLQPTEIDMTNFPWVVGVLNFMEFIK